jgi:hypothetical protein
MLGSCVATRAALARPPATQNTERRLAGRHATPKHPPHQPTHSTHSGRTGTANSGRSPSSNPFQVIATLPTQSASWRGRPGRKQHVQGAEAQQHTWDFTHASTAARAALLYRWRSRSGRFQGVGLLQGLSAAAVARQSAPHCRQCHLKGPARSTVGTGDPGEIKLRHHPWVPLMQAATLFVAALAVQAHAWVHPGVFVGAPQLDFIKARSREWP